MATNYNPCVSVSNLLMYFDSMNIKSYTSNALHSLVSSDTIQVNTSNINGFLYNSNTKLNSLSTNINSYNSITFVVSMATLSTSVGTIFSIYDDQNTYYKDSSNTGYSHSVLTNISLSANSYSNSYVASSNTRYSHSVLTNPSLSANSYTSSFTVSSNTGYSHSTLTNTSLSANSYSNSFVVSSNTGYSHSSLTNPGLSIDLFRNYPNNCIEFSYTKNNVNCRIKNGPYDNFVSCVNDVSAVNDLYTINFNKNSYSSTPVKIYKNTTLLLTSGTFSGISSFPNTITFFSKYNAGDFTNLAIRSIMLYTKELTNSEILQINSAIIQH